MTKELFNDNWIFNEKPIQQNLFSIEELKRAPVSGTHVDVPHDWLINDTKRLYRDSEGWYFKTFEMPDEELSKRHFIEFDGVYMDSEVYLNGNFVGCWKNGYTSFEFELTDYLQSGKNLLFVRVQHRAPNSRWYSGAGIYRNVWLRSVNNVYIERNGVYIHTKRKSSIKNDWEILLDVCVMNPRGYERSLVVRHTIYNKNEEIVMIEEKSHHLEGIKNKQIYSSKLVLEKPALWSPNEPNLYRVETTIIGTGFFDKVDSTLGFRVIELDPREGFLLNDESFKIKGVCQHHDLGALGSAINKSALKRQLKKLKEMGVNAIRTAHNPSAPELLSLADEMGFLVQSELTDVWKHSKTTYDYARFFDEWIERDVESWIKQDRKHPSVFMWSIGNEVYDTHGREDGLETTQHLIDLVKRHDPLGNGAITFGSNYLLWETTQKAADMMKVVGYNYGENMYEEHHKKYPQWVIYGSETCSVVQSRGVYHFPLSQSILADDDRQCSSLGNSTTSWGAKSIESCIIRDRDMPFSLGQFIWTGFDYIGEPTPYNTKNSYFGQIDTAGFEKDAFYIFQASWVPYEEKPMIHLFPYWDFSPKQLIDVRICSNAPEVELFFNSKSLGRRANDLKHGDRLIHDWSIPYEPGELIARAYDLTGTVIAEDRVQSFGDAVRLKLKADRTVMDANGEDLIFVEIECEDEAGIPVANANNRVHIYVTGPGRLVGIDNGDSTDYDQYKENSKRLFNGKLLAIIAPTHTPGEIVVKVESKGLPTAQVVLMSKAVDLPKGISTALVNNHLSMIESELPVRKIEITNLTGKTMMDSSSDVVKLKAKIHPNNADYQQVEWRLTDSKGIDSSLAALEIDDDIAAVSPKADGRIFVRCGTRNSGEFINLYSLLDLRIDGIKQACLNPYQPISGGLFTRSNVALTNGNERGVATLRGEESWVTFDDIDFGTIGSSKITLALFPLEGNVFSIDIWRGHPYEKDSQLVDTVEYTKGTIWNTYQEQTYELSQKFVGNQSVSFVFNQKVHIRDFVFLKNNRAFESISILDNDLMYGDSFSIHEETIEGIGNNVTIEFNDMDFGRNGTNAIKIVGQSPNNRNSIQIKFSGEVHEERRILEFEASEGYESKEFKFDTIFGNQKVEFIFLPGSNFNFKEFQFIENLN